MSKSNTATFTIENNTARPQTYVLYSDPPQITGPVQGRVWPIIISSTTIPAQQTGSFKLMPKYFQAICGVTDRQLASGTRTAAAGSKAVSLGEKRIDGTKTSGTTLSLEVSSKNTPEFARVSPTPAAGAGAFEVVTGDEPVIEDVRRNHLIIGYGVYPKPTPRSNLAACFTPAPNARYQIKPSQTYYIASTNTNAEVGSLIDPESKFTPGLVCKIDLDGRDKDGAACIHEDSGLRVR